MTQRDHGTVHHNIAAQMTSFAARMSREQSASGSVSARDNDDVDDENRDCSGETMTMVKKNIKIAVTSSDFIANNLVLTKHENLLTI